MFRRLGSTSILTRWIKRSRIRPNQVEKFKVYFEKASWKLCSDLRSNKIFKEASQAITQDVSAYQEALIRDEPASSNQLKCKLDESSAGDASCRVPRGNAGRARKSRARKAWQSSGLPQTMVPQSDGAVRMLATLGPRHERSSSADGGRLGKVSGSALSGTSDDKFR